jgi:hypothetical protein
MLRKLDNHRINFIPGEHPNLGSAANNCGEEITSNVTDVTLDPLNRRIP